MSLGAFSSWLAASPASHAIQSHFWVVPTVQSIHIMAIAAVAASSLLLDLRLVAGRGEPFGAYARRYLPWIWLSLIVLLLTGATMIVGEPGRTLFNWVFWTKMSLVAAALVVTLIIQTPALRDGHFWDAAGRRRPAIVLAIVSILLWALVIVCGRWIAYVL